MKISKSKFMEYLRCKKAYWHLTNSNNKYDINPLAKFNGEIVEEEFYKLNNVDVNITSYDANGKIDISKMLVDTKYYLTQETTSIAQATLEKNKYFGIIDMLKNNHDGTYDLYEIKSGTEFIGEYYYDSGFQLMVATQSGIKIKNVFVVILNKNYIEGVSYKSELFIYMNVSNKLKTMKTEIERMLIEMDALGYMPDYYMNINKSCKECPYFNDCFPEINNDSVFNLHRIRFEKAKGYYDKGIKSFYDLDKYKSGFTKVQKNQIDAVVKNQSIIFDKDIIHENYMSNIIYPIHFLDFESSRYPIPRFYGTQVYEEIPFQYSIHILHEDNHVIHKEYLAPFDTDSREELLKNLLMDIGLKGTIISHHKSTEIGIIRKLIEKFPMTSYDLDIINKRFVDSLDLFSKGGLYHRNMENSLSIKKIYESFYPNDEDSYHKLEIVKDGSSASVAWMSSYLLDNQEKGKLRKHMLSYCRLDTLAMLKMHQKIEKIIST